MAALEVFSIDRDTWRFEEEGVRFFLLRGNERALFIDSGAEQKSLREIGERYTDLPVSLLLTDSDRDHVGGVDDFPSFMMNPADCCHWYKKGGSGVVKPIYDGDIIDLGGRRLEVIACPGHSPGSVAILDHGSGALFSGDTVQNGNIFLYGPYRDIHAFLFSLDRLEKRRDRYDTIYPCHGTFPVSPMQFRKLRDGAKRVLRGQVEGKDEIFWGRECTVYETGSARLVMEKSV